MNTVVRAAKKVVTTLLPLVHALDSGKVTGARLASCFRSAEHVRAAG